MCRISVPSTILEINGMSTANKTLLEVWQELNDHAKTSLMISLLDGHGRCVGDSSPTRAQPLLLGITQSHRAYGKCKVARPSIHCQCKQQGRMKKRLARRLLALRLATISKQRCTILIAMTPQVPGRLSLCWDNRGRSTSLIRRTLIPSFG